MLKELPKVGDKVRYVGDYCDFLTQGKEYEITMVGVRNGVFYAEYYDDEDDLLDFGVSELGDWELVETAPDVTDLIANLARRVSELETHLAPKECEVGPEDSSDTPKAAQIRQACDTVRDLLIRKNHDYGDSFAQQYAKYGLQSALIRMDDKMCRLETLTDGKQAQVDESIEDTLADLAGYALLALVEARAARE